MSGPVVVNTTSGMPTLALNDGATANYDAVASNPTDGTLVFDYTVGVNDRAKFLSISNVSLNGAVVQDSGGHIADFTVALGQYVNVAIGSSLLELQVGPATVIAVASSEIGEISSGQQVHLEIDVDAGITVNTSGGSPTLTLNDGATATYNSTLSDPSIGALVFDYTVGANEHTSNLEITSANPNGAVIRDFNGSDVDFSGALDVLTNIVIRGATPDDFNGDSKSDLMWRENGSGTFTEWQSTGNGVKPNVYVNGSVTNAWMLAGIGDFSGDGRADLLWFNNGTFTVWDSTGNGFAPNSFIGSAGPGWTLTANADFNGDGTSDLLWQNGTTFTEWQSTGNNFTPNVFVGSVTAGWTLAATGDFTGNGEADLVWFNAGSGTFTIWDSTGKGFTPNRFIGSVGPGWTLAGVSDFTGNGRDDLLWFNAGSGTFTIWDSTGNGFTPNSFVGSVAPGWQLVGTGDYNGTGMSDLLWRNTTTGTFTEWRSTGNGFTPNTLVSSVPPNWTLIGNPTHTNGDPPASAGNAASMLALAAH
jgi:hypothetical protein